MNTITRQKLSKHERYVELLSDIVGRDYDFLLESYPLYSKRNRLVGEIDLVGVKGNKADLFEVKCSHRITKAKHQLKKAKGNFDLYKIRDTFFFCGASKALISV